MGALPETVGVVAMSYTVTECNGLHTSSNPLTAPKGALKSALNVMVRVKDVLEPRRGQNLAPDVFGQSHYRANELCFWGDVYASQLTAAILVQVDDARLFYFDGASLVEYAGNYAPPDPAKLRMKFAQFDRKLHFTTSLGLKMLDGLNNTPREMGLPKPFDVEVRSTTFDFDADRNWLPDDCSVGVRVLFCRKDVDNRISEGPPSERAVVKNTDGSNRSLRVVVGIPDGLTTSDFVRVYMTDTSIVDGDPGDEQYLLIEAQLTSGELTAGQVTKDITSVEAVLSDNALYTNPNNGDGIEASKLPPPWAKDICRWGGRLWAFNLKRKHELRLTLLGISDDGDGTGLDEGDASVVTVNGKGYVFGGSAHETGDAVGANCWVKMVVTAGPDGTAEVAKRFVQAINSFDDDVRAYYVARFDGWPGEILIESVALGGSPFSVVGDIQNAQAFSPNLSTYQYSTNGAQEHGFACSDKDEPEAWPLFNYGTAGNKGSAILRGIPLRDSLMCLMSDGTVQVVSGSAPPFRVEELDSSAQLVGADTARVLNNQIWALTRQGVVSISEAGVVVIGMPVEVDIRRLFIGATDSSDPLTFLLGTVERYSFAFAYETERCYALWVPARPGETAPSLGYLYNYATKTWTNWPIARTCGMVDPFTDKLWMGHATLDTLWVERKALTNDDFCDEQSTVSLTSFSGKVLNVATSVGLAVGDVLEQGLLRSVVTEVTDATHVRVSTVETWTSPGTLDSFKGYECEVEWKPVDMGAPGNDKNARQLTLHFLEASFWSAEAWLASDVSFTFSRTNELQRLGFGALAWGDFPWGDPNGPWNARTAVAEQKGSAAFYFPRFTIREAKSQWKLIGYTLDAVVESERTKK